MIQWIWESSVDDAAKREIQPTLDRLTQRVADREYREAVEKLVSELLGMPDLGDQGRRRGRDGRSDIQRRVVKCSNSSDDWLPTMQRPFDPAPVTTPPPTETHAEVVARIRRYNLSDMIKRWCRMSNPPTSPAPSPARD